MTYKILCCTMVALLLTVGCVPPPDQGEVNRIDEQTFSLDGETPWKTHQYLRAYAKRNTTYPSYISLTVEDWGPGTSEDSSYFRAVVNKRVDGKLKVFYSCEIDDPAVAAVSRLPDNGSFIGPTKGLSYTLVAPECNGYKAAIFTVTCDAANACHSQEGSTTKNTLPDGTHTFSTTKRETLSGPSCSGVISKCTITFDNHPYGGGVWIKKGKGYATAFEEAARDQ